MKYRNIPGFLAQLLMQCRLVKQGPEEQAIQPGVYPQSYLVFFSLYFVIFPRLGFAFIGRRGACRHHSRQLRQFSSMNYEWHREYRGVRSGSPRTPRYLPCSCIPADRLKLTAVVSTRTTITLHSHLHPISPSSTVSAPYHPSSQFSG